MAPRVAAPDGGPGRWRAWPVARGPTIAEMTATTSDSQLVTVTPEARTFMLEARDAEGEEGLALFLEVTGASGGTYDYDLWFEALSEVGAGDVHQDLDGLDLVVPEDSADRLRGATLDLGHEGGAAGLVLVNPNAPPRGGSPAGTGERSGPLAAAVLEVLEHEVNPQIASHGGRAELVGVDDAGVAYLRLSGGCQGCGMAQATLSQGIAVAVTQAVPGITDVVDVTAHEAGTSPYYEATR